MIMRNTLATKIVSVVIGLIVVCLLTTVCFAGTVKAGATKKAIKYPEETKKLLEKIRHSGHEDTAKLIYEYASAEPTEEGLWAMFNLMDNKEVILKDDPLYSSANIQVRDIAFVCLQELTGNIFKNEYKGKEIITYFSEDGTPYRFTIPLFSESDYRAVKANIKYWIGNFKKEQKEE